MSELLLDVKGLKTSFFTSNGEIPSVNNVSFSVNKGETVAIVGESGCGKSVTSLSIMQLIGSPGKIKEGNIFFEGIDLLSLSKREMRKYRGNELSMIFQEPMSSLNPVYTIGKQIVEVLREHLNITKKEANLKSIDLLKKVGIANAENVVKNYPHQLSGGMRQRIMIAIALACVPKLLIADEPTTALDVTVQAQILKLISNLSKEQKMGVILITHDLGVVAEMADKVIVMYAGEVVEEATVFELFKNPSHPYTIGLIKSIPKIEEPKDVLETIEGTVPNLLELSTGCSFASRCTFATDECLSVKPELIHKANEHRVRCIRVEEVSFYAK